MIPRSSATRNRARPFRSSRVIAALRSRFRGSGGGERRRPPDPCRVHHRCAEARHGDKDHAHSSVAWREPGMLALFCGGPFRGRGPVRSAGWSAERSCGQNGENGQATHGDRVACRAGWWRQSWAASLQSCLPTGSGDFSLHQGLCDRSRADWFEATGASIGGTNSPGPGLTSEVSARTPTICGLAPGSASIASAARIFRAWTRCAPRRRIRGLSSPIPCEFCSGVPRRFRHRGVNSHVGTGRALDPRSRTWVGCRRVSVASPAGASAAA